ncbi:hypothetical protein LXL04_002336 [Taraxacum kok-saghyz]
MDDKTGNGAPKPRKMKFTPKAPPRREKKLVLPKSEKFEDAEGDDLKAQELMKRFKESSNKPRFKTETQPSKTTRVSSFSFGPSSGGGNTATSSIGAKEYKEPWDYYKYYPVTLPVRVPYSGNPELLDEEEFKDDSETNVYNESSLKPAEELGLFEEDLEKKLIFMQLPATMPIPNQSVKKEGGSSKPLKNNLKASSLNELPSGKMGKMLVYKSGAVKLKLGDHLYNVSGGLDCSFAQDLVTMNTEEEYCCTVGELNKRAIITPDIESVLENMNIS